MDQQYFSKDDQLKMHNDFLDMLDVLGNIIPYKVGVPVNPDSENTIFDFYYPDELNKEQIQKIKEYVRFRTK